jgi:hypothetical protein
MGLVGVVSTQLWHHTFIDGTLADLPSLATTSRPRGVEQPSLANGHAPAAVLGQPLTTNR